MREAHEAVQKRNAGQDSFYAIDLNEERKFILPIPSGMRR